eukprot:4600748-Pleurochrysis_carterae.AAC.2
MYMHMRVRMRVHVDVRDLQQASCVLRSHTLGACCVRRAASMLLGMSCSILEPHAPKAPHVHARALRKNTSEPRADDSRFPVVVCMHTPTPHAYGMHALVCVRVGISLLRLTPLRMRA